MVDSFIVFIEGREGPASNMCFQVSEDCFDSQTGHKTHSKLLEMNHPPPSVLDWMGG